MGAGGGAGRERKGVGGGAHGRAWKPDVALLLTPLSLLTTQMDPKFLRNQRYAKHHNKVADKA
jgi:hypothetical protein